MNWTRLTAFACARNALVFRESGAWELGEFDIDVYGRRGNPILEALRKFV
jgi:hypothetical protein